MVETRQSRRARQQQKLPIQPLVALDVATGERFLPKLPEFIQAESTEPPGPTVLPNPNPPNTEQVHRAIPTANTTPASAGSVLPVVTDGTNTEPSMPKAFICAERGVRIMAFKSYTKSHYKKEKQIMFAKKNKYIHQSSSNGWFHQH